MAKSNQVTPIRPETGQQLATNSVQNLTPQVVKDLICKDATNEEIDYFIHYCRTTNLDPILKQIHLVKYGKQSAFIVVDVYEYIRPATESPNYNGYKAGLILEIDGEIVEREGEFVQLKKGEIILGAWCQCYRKDAEYLPKVTLAFELWTKNQATWNDNPAHMIYKTAIKHGFKQSFPGIFRTLPEDDFQIAQDESVRVEIEEQNNTDPTPETVDVEKAIYDQRRKHFFKHMNERHGISNTQEIRDHVSSVLEKEVEHISDFLKNDNDFLVWADRDQFETGELFD